MTSNLMTVEHHAMLFALLAKSVVLRWGDKGEQTIRQAVRQYGEERGQRMGERAAYDGEPRNMVSYFCYGELDFEGTENASHTVQESPYRVQEVTRCSWNSTWRKENLLDVGRLYCLEVDEALLRGFNPRLLLEIEGTLSNGAPCCVFHWKSANLLPHQQMRMRMLADRVGRSAIRPWSFHVAHIYHTMTRVVKKAYGDEGESVIHQGIAAFGARYGEEMVARIQTIASAEFGR